MLHDACHFNNFFIKCQLKRMCTLLQTTLTDCIGWRFLSTVPICGNLKKKKKFYKSTNSGGMKVKFEIENLKIHEKYDGCSNLPTSYDE